MVSTFMSIRFKTQKNLLKKGKDSYQNVTTKYPNFSYFVKELSVVEK